MAHTARSRDEKREYFDSPEELDRKVAMLADWVKHSKHMIAFTVRSLTIICRLSCYNTIIIASVFQCVLWCDENKIQATECY